MSRSVKDKLLNDLKYQVDNHFRGRNKRLSKHIWWYLKDKVCDQVIEKVDEVRFRVKKHIMGLR